MGRRAKRKQADPESFQDLSEHAPPKKLGKRKAGIGTSLPQPTKKSKHKDSLQDDDSLNGVEDTEDDGSSRGREGIQDEDTLPAQTRCVASCTSNWCTPHRLKNHRSLFEDSEDDAFDSDRDENEDEDAPITASNFAARSRALDARAAREAQLDAEELQNAAQVEADEFDGVEDMDDDEDEVDAPGAEDFVLPTTEERAEEKRSGGPEVHVVQKRMRECVRILKRWKVSGARTGRFVISSI
jgi:ribosomal RNA methyltransferase Nop2